MILHTKPHLLFATTMLPLSIAVTSWGLAHAPPTATAPAPVLHRLTLAPPSPEQSEAGDAASGSPKAPAGPAAEQVELGAQRHVSAQHLPAVEDDELVQPWQRAIFAGSDRDEAANEPELIQEAADLARMVTILERTPRATLQEWISQGRIALPGVASVDDLRAYVLALRQEVQGERSRFRAQVTYRPRSGPRPLAEVVQ
ncbi:MAG: hypothetical protein HYV63_26685 [Candidatus Schekmanbacteria bacterium]|nr:hypothetical protein [Candidatus Schekmanbacteria bacterium]